MVTTVLGYAETYAILLRNRNRGALDARTYRTASSALQSDILDSPDFGVVDVEYSAVLDGIVLVTRHNLNSSDAAILTTFLRYAHGESAPCVLVTADKRLARAASVEGLHTLNPELVPID